MIITNVKSAQSRANYIQINNCINQAMKDGGSVRQYYVVRDSANLYKAIQDVAKQLTSRGIQFSTTQNCPTSATLKLQNGNSIIVGSLF